MPASSAWHYGATDPDCGTIHGGGRGSSRPSLDHSPTVVAPNHVDNLVDSLGKKHKDPHASNPNRLYLSPADMGVLKSALVSGAAPTCSMPPPPPLAVADSYVTTVTMTSSANIESFNDTVRSTIVTNFATAASVPESAVMLTVEAASVRITIAITSATPAAATAVTQALAPSLASTTAAAALLPTGITLTAAPRMATAAVATPSSSGNSGLGDGEIAGIAIAGAVGGIVLLLIVMMIIKSNNNKGKPIFTCLEALNPKEDKKGTNTKGGQPPNP